MVHVFEGKTTNEAIEKGLKELGVSKDKVEIKVLQNEEKRIFFSILTPRVVKIEMTIKEQKNKKENRSREKEEIQEINLVQARGQLEQFLQQWILILPSDNITYQVRVKDHDMEVEIDGEDLNYLIGYRGEVLTHLQTILSAVASKKEPGKVRVRLNICGYRQKREKALEDLAEKLAKTVIRTQKSLTLEPMSAYERKIIHSKLQNHAEVITTSIGEEPYRKIVISLKTK